MGYNNKGFNPAFKSLILKKMLFSYKELLKLKFIILKQYPNK
jgi:hypothetical protein